MDSSIFELAVDDIDNAVEPQVIDTEEEVLIRITEVRADLNKNNQPYWLISFDAPDIPGSKGFTKYFGLPNDDMDAKKKNNANLALRRFFQAFEIDYTAGTVDPGTFQGLTSWALLGIETPEAGSDQEKYGPSNYIRKFIGNGK